MNWTIAAANWGNFKGTVRARWGKFTDEYLDSIAGQREQLLQKIAETYEIPRADAQRELKAFEDRNRNYRPK